MPQTRHFDQVKLPLAHFCPSEALGVHVFFLVCVGLVWWDKAAQARVA